MNLSRRHFLTSAMLAAATVRGAAAQTTTEPLRAAVIGDTREGGYGHDLHLLWALHPGIEVTALADPDEAGRNKRGAESGAKRLYADYREMLANENPHLVSIAPRWTTRHEEYLLACAEHGAHGVIEKPLTPDLAGADTVINAIDAKNLKWNMAFNYRASPLLDHARKCIVEDGLIGDVLEIRSRGKEDHRAGGEDLIVLGIHTFDIMAHFFGPPQWCSADITVHGRPATPADVREATEPLGPVLGNRLQAAYRFDGGIFGYFASQDNTHGNQDRWGMEFFGSKGIVTIRMSQIPRVFWLDEPSWAPGAKDLPWKPLPGAPAIQPGDSPIWHYQPIVRDLVEAIQHDRQPKYSIHDGRTATGMIQAVWESHVQGKPVTFPLQRRTHPLKDWT